MIIYKTYKSYFSFMLNEKVDSSVVSLEDILCFGVAVAHYMYL